MKAIFILLISFWVLTIKAEKIAADSDGNVYLLGLVQDTLTFSDSTVITAYPWETKTYLAKVDSVGDVLWFRVFETYVNFNIKVDNSNNLLMITQLAGSIELDSTTMVSGNSCLLIVKYDSTGKLLWYKLSSNNTIYTYYDVSLAVDSHDNVYTLGVFSGVFYFNGVDTLYNPNGTYLKVFVAKFDSTGNNIWLRKVDGDSDSAYEIDSDGMGNSIIVGNFGNYGDSISYQGNSLFALDGSDGFWIKIDSNGDLIEMKKIYSSQFDRTYSIGVSRNGSFSYAGSFGGDTLFIDNFPLTIDTSNGPNRHGHFVAHVNHQNSENWLVNYNHNWAAYKFHGVEMDNSGNTYLYTLYDAFSYNTSLNSFVGSDISNSNYVIKIDSGRNFVCLFHVENGQISDIEVTDDGQVFVVGSFQNTLSLNGIPYVQIGNNIFVARFDSNCDITSTTFISNPITGINELPLDFKPSLYPNPSTDRITLSLGGHQIKHGDAILFTLQGLKIRELEFSNANRIDIDIHDLVQGIYILQLTIDGNRRTNFKIVKI